VKAVRRSARAAGVRFLSGTAVRELHYQATGDGTRRGPTIRSGTKREATVGAMLGYTGPGGGSVVYITWQAPLKVPAPVRQPPTVTPAVHPIWHFFCNLLIVVFATLPQPGREATWAAVLPNRALIPRWHPWQGLALETAAAEADRPPQYSRS